MKMKKILASSIATIALAASLASGATYALFTSSSDVNIAITSGKVNVKASISKLTTYSGLWDTASNSYADQLVDKDVAVGNFTNGGNAKINGNELIINRITPMDKVEFTIDIENLSNVTTLFKTVIQCSEGDFLFNKLDIKVNNNDFNQKYYTSGWIPLGANEQISSVAISIALPEDAGNEYQGLTTKIKFAVDLTQGNTHNNTVATYEELKQAIANASDGDEIYLQGSTVFDGAVVDSTVFNPNDTLENRIALQQAMMANRLLINKSVTLIGLNNFMANNNPIITGAIEVAADDVTFYNIDVEHFYINDADHEGKPKTHSYYFRVKGENFTFVNGRVEKTNDVSPDRGNIILYTNPRGVLSIINSTLIAPYISTLVTASMLAVLSAEVENYQGEITNSIFMDNCIVETNGLVLFDHTERVEIQNCQFYGITYNGTYSKLFMLINNTHMKNLIINNSLIHNTSSTAIYVDGGDILISNNTFFSCSVVFSIGQDSTTVSISSLTVTNNVVDYTRTALELATVENYPSERAGFRFGANTFPDDQFIKVDGNTFKNAKLSNVNTYGIDATYCYCSRTAGKTVYVSNTKLVNCDLGISVYYNYTGAGTVEEI